jgi:hypothetical protein
MEIIPVEALIVVMGLIVFLVTTMNDLQLRIVPMHFFCLLLPLPRRNGLLGFDCGFERKRAGCADSRESD